MEVVTNTTVVPFEDILNSLNEVADKEKKGKIEDFFTRIEDSPPADQIVAAKKPEEQEGSKEPPLTESKVETESAKQDPPKEEPVKVEKIENVVDDIISGEPKKVEQTGDIHKLYMELVKNEVITGFDDDQPVTSLEELQYLIEENRKKDREKILSEELPQFVESLPEEVQALVKYASEGGKDFKGMFRALAEVEEFRQIEVKEEDRRGQEEVAYRYLKATNYARGNENKIRELIDEWVDNNTIYKRSKEFKVELDEMGEQLVAQKLKEQEKRAKEEEKRQQEVKQAVYNSIIKEDNLNGIKLDKQTQQKIFAGLTNKAWKSSLDGREMDMLDALVEYYRVHKPDYKLLGEALYLLLEPENYKKKVSSEIKQKLAGETQRVLKTEEGRRTSSSSVAEPKGISRKPTNNNFWK